MHRYLFRFLTSSDATFQHIAVWTIVQLLESGGTSHCPGFIWVDSDSSYSILDPQLISNIRSSSILIPNIRNLASSRPSSPSSSVGTPRSHHSHLHSEHDTEAGDGQGEIQVLSRRILEYVDNEAENFVPSSVGMQHGSSVASSAGREHEELRRSVREAFAPGSHR
jgi:vacuolar protein 8